MKRIVIVGQGPRAFEHRPDDEVWVINGPRFPERWDVLFQLHGLDHIEHKHGVAFIEMLRRFGRPRELRTRSVTEPWAGGSRLIMTRRYDSVPAAEAYPLTDVVDACGRYLTGSFALAIAYALLDPPAEILLDGVMFSGGPAQWGAGEGWAVPCIEYHLGRANAMGVKTHVPPGCGLFEHSDFVYGFEGPGCV